MSTQRLTVVKLSKSKDNEKLLKAEREKGTSHVQGLLNDINS